jgi:nucleoside-diphosphate-sugar epimerase
LELAYGLFGARSEPRMTRFLAAQLALAHYFDISAAKRDLGYSPRVSTAEGIENLIESLQPS